MDNVYIKHNAVDKIFIDRLLSQDGFRKATTGDRLHSINYGVKHNNHRAWQLDPNDIDDSLIKNIFKNANDEIFNFDIDWEQTKIQGFLKKYKSEDFGHFDWHYDFLSESFANLGFRLLSMSIILNTDYKGGELTFLDSETEFTPKNLREGSAIVFPCDMFHCVKGVESGTRYSLVLWLWHKDNYYLDNT